MNKRRLLLLVVLIGALAAYFGYNYAYKDHRDIETETSVVTVSAFDMEQYFLTNKSEEVLNKTVTVTGSVTEIEEGSLTIDNKVQCSFSVAPNAVVGDNITVKGRCIGYDDLFELVKLDQSTLTKN